MFYVHEKWQVKCVCGGRQDDSSELSATTSPWS